LPAPQDFDEKIYFTKLGPFPVSPEIAHTLCRGTTMDGSDTRDRRGSRRAAFFCPGRKARQQQQINRVPLLPARPIFNILGMRTS